MSSLRLLSALLCLSVFPALCADLDLIQNAPARQGVSLNGPWHAIVDPYESGYYDYRYQPQADGGYGANTKPQSKSDLIEYDFATAGLLQVPGDWNTQRPELMLYEGTVWYQRDFDITIPPGHRVFVWFGAANYRAMVFLTKAVSRPFSSKSPARSVRRATSSSSRWTTSASRNSFPP
jgi:beta-glucuronidase